MIRLTFDEPVNDAEWSDWCDRGAASAAAMLAGPPDAPRAIDAALYKEQRDRFLTVTNRKCAYCETFLVPGQREGDVEHYRPKGRVKDRNGKVVLVQSGGVARPHPGYFWLAYDFRNLLPSCLACNRRATDARSGRVTGKGDIFPTLDDWWATTPEEVERESPALLNPWTDDPANDLRFDTDTGLVAGLTERGRQSVELLGLNRDGLVEDRRMACETVAADFYLLVARLSSASSTTVDRILRVRSGVAEYAAICRAQLIRNENELRDTLRGAGVLLENNARS